MYCSRVGRSPEAEVVVAEEDEDEEEDEEEEKDCYRGCNLLIKEQ